MEVPFFAYLVLKEAAVRLLHPLRQVAEEYERGNHGILEHSDVFNLHKLTSLLLGGGVIAICSSM